MSPLKGLSTLKHNLEQYREKKERQAVSAVQSVLTDVLDDSRANYVPVDSGTLRDDSGVIVESSGGVVTGRVFYGAGPARDYAIPIHETPSKHDPPNWNGQPIQFKTGGPKFLEIPYRTAEKGMLQRIAERMKG